MTKSELIDVVAEKLKMQHNTAEQIVNLILDQMSETLVNNGRIEIRGFGSFVNRHYEPYKGRNPRTGESIEVKPKRLPFFKVGKELRERVDGRWVPGTVTAEDDLDTGDEQE